MGPGWAACSVQWAFRPDPRRPPPIPVRFAPLLFLALATLALGCRSAALATPPERSPLPQGPPAAEPPELAAFGLLQIDLDPTALTAAGKVVDIPQRVGQTGFESVNLTSYLDTAPCGDCLRVEGIALANDGKVALTIGIRHPFPAGDPTQPPSAKKNRLDLHLYNVEGVVLTNEYSRRTVFPILGQIAAQDMVANPDGYSGNLAPSLVAPLGFDLTVYPYKLFFRDYSGGNFDPAAGYTDVVNPRGHNVMPMGIGYDRKTYLLNFQTPGSRRLYLAAQASLGLAAQPPGSLLNPIYRLPQFAKKAASEIQAAVIRNELRGGDTTSSATLRVQVLDANHGVAAGPGLGEMRFASHVARFDLEAPGLVSTRVIVNGPMPISGSPRNIFDPLTYEVTVPNSAGAEAGTYLALLRVQDSYPAASTLAPLDGKDVLDAPGTREEPLANTRSLANYSTYFVLPLTVATGACAEPPPAITASAPHDPLLGMPYSYQFAATGGTAPLTYRIASGTLPPGLALSPDGLLSGQVPDRAAFFQAWPLTVEVADGCPSGPRVDTVDLTLHVDLRPLTFVYFDIGQGHSTLVYTAAGQAMLIDTGPSDRPQGERIGNYIRSRGLHLKYVVGSHFDGDHIGSISYIMSGPDGRPGRRNVDDDGDGGTDSFEDAEEYGWPGSDDFTPVACFDTGNDDLQTQQSDRIWRAAVSRTRVPWSTALLGDHDLLDLGDPGLDLWFAAGNRAVFNGTNPGRDTEDENSNSLVLILRHGAFDTEIGGDLPGLTGGGGSNVETPVASALQATGFGLDLMLAHHHGSRYSSGTAWLSAMKPEVILIQCGNDNPYGHPHQELLNRFETVLWDPTPRVLDQVVLTERGTLEARTFDGVPIESSPVFTIAEADVTVVTDGRTYTVTEPAGVQTYSVDASLP